MAGDEEGFFFDSAEEAPPPAAVTEEGVEGEAAPAPEGEFLPEGEELAEPPPAPKKKPKFFVHWNRRKPRFYDYNYDFGENYYSSMVNYMNKKSLGSTDVPRRMAWAERGMYSSLARKNLPDSRTESLLNEVRSSIRNFENCQRSYIWQHTKKVA